MYPGKFYGITPVITSTTPRPREVTTLTLVDVCKTSTGTSITLPSGLQQYDIVFVASFNGASTIPAVPSGYTEGQRGDGGDVQYQWSYKIMGATPDSTATGLSSGCAHLAFAFRNVDNDTIFDVTTPAVSTDALGIGMPDPPSTATVYATVTGTVTVGIGFLDDDSITPSASSGYTLLGYAQNGGTIMAEYITNASTFINYNPGAFGGTGSDAWVGATFVLKRRVDNGSHNGAAVWTLDDVFYSKT